MVRREKTPEELEQEAYLKDLKLRLRARFRNTPADELDDNELLSIFLSYSIRNYDYVKAADELIEHFGSLHGVMEARYDSLRQFTYVRQNTAVAIRALATVCKRAEMERRPKHRQIKQPQDAADYLYPYFIGCCYEKAFLLLLNDRFYPQDVVFLADGSGDDVFIDQKKVVREALMHKSTKVILAHSHPASMALPSYADKIATVTLSQTLRNAGITLLEHVIVSGMNYCFISEDEEITKDILAFSQREKPMKRNAATANRGKKK
ncbi:MAG: RadC family protein [Clostridia bacterium]|nr:RadC family protein [Clostridia bacterium]